MDFEAEYRRQKVRHTDFADCPQRFWKYARAQKIGLLKSPTRASRSCCLNSNGAGLGSVTFEYRTTEHRAPCTLAQFSPLSHCRQATSGWVWFFNRASFSEQEAKRELVPFPASFTDFHDPTRFGRQGNGNILLVNGNILLVNDNNSIHSIWNRSRRFQIDRN
jgi:hypothetical protein